MRSSWSSHHQRCKVSQNMWENEKDGAWEWGGWHIPSHLFSWNSQTITRPWFLTWDLTWLHNHLSDKVSFGFRGMLPEHERDGLTTWSDLFEVSADSKVDQAAQPIVSGCQAFGFSIKSARRLARSASVVFVRDLEPIRMSCGHPGAVSHRSFSPWHRCLNNSH